MGNSVRVLIVEDSEDDAMMLVRQLRRGGYVPTCERVDTSESMTAALDRQKWDLVISDYVMPQFSGLAALTLVRQRGHELPFIMVSGKVGEEFAVAAMRSGAQDYILKTNLARLVPIVERELRESEVRRARKQAELALQESQDRYYAMARLSPVGMFHTDATGSCTYVNERWCEMSGLAVAESLSRGWIKAIHPDDLKIVWQDWEKAIQSGSCFHGEFRICRPDATIRWVLGQAVPERAAAGEISGYFGTLTDITAHKQAQALERERMSLKDAVAAMEQVLGVVGHELRTPLASIRAISEFLATEGAKQTAQFDTFLTNMNEEAIRMGRTIDDLLEAARLNSGRANWNWTEFDLAAACDSALNSIRPLLNQQVSLKVDVDPPDARMRGDCGAVQRLLINLVSNARKHTPQGGIHVDTRAYEEQGECWVELKVRDSGCGIPPQIMSRLGEAFALNAGVIGAGDIKGTGLGLAICKGIVAAHGGMMNIQSTLGVGTAVTVRVRSDLDQPATDQIKIELAASQ